MKKSIIFSLMLAFSPLFASMESIPVRDVKEVVLENLYDFSSLLEVSDAYLRDYQNVLQNAKELLYNNKNTVLTSQAKKELLDQLVLHAEEARQIINRASFNHQALFFQSEDSYEREIFVVLDEHTSSESFIFSNPLFQDQKLLLEDLYQIKATPQGIADGLMTLDRAISRLFEVRSQVRAYFVRVQNIIDLQKSLLQDKNDEKGEFKGYVKKIETQMYELSVRSCNGVFSSEDREALDFHFQELKSELVRISNISGIRSQFLTMGQTSILHREEAEKVMLSFKSAQ